MGTLQDSIGAASATQPRFTGTDLSRYNNSMVGAFSFGDSAGSEYAVSAVPGLPIQSMIVDGPTLGATGIIGTGTAMSAVTATTNVCPFIGNWKPYKDTGFTISVWFETSTTPTTSWDVFGFDDGTNTGRLKVLWYDTPKRFDWLDSNTFREGITPATDFATDYGDGNPHLLTARYRAGAFDIFVDGTKGTTVTTAWAADPANNPDQLFGMFTAGTVALTAVYQHLYIWGAGLSDDAVSDLYNSGSGRFVDGT